MKELIELLKQHYDDIHIYHHTENGTVSIYITKDSKTTALVCTDFSGLNVYL